MLHHFFNQFPIPPLHHGQLPYGVTRDDPPSHGFPLGFLLDVNAVAYWVKPTVQMVLRLLIRFTRSSPKSWRAPDTQRGCGCSQRRGSKHWSLSCAHTENSHQSTGQWLLGRSHIQVFRLLSFRLLRWSREIMMASNRKPFHKTSICFSKKKKLKREGKSTKWPEVFIWLNSSSCLSMTLAIKKQAALYRQWKCQRWGEPTVSLWDKYVFWKGLAPFGHYQLSVQIINDKN